MSGWRICREGAGRGAGRILLVTAHRRENLGAAMEEIGSGSRRTGT